MNIPAELDVLDSPVSPVPYSGLGIPNSALAEKIFNDPDSWEDTDGNEGDYPEDVEDDTLAWLSEEIEKVRVHSAGNGAFQVPSEKRDSKDSTLLPAPRGTDSNADWRGIARRSGVRPISLAGLFEQSQEDFSNDIQHHLSKILDSGGIKHHIGPRPLSATLSPPSTSGSSMTDSLPSASSVASSSLGDASPAPAQSASATLSFLEYYGIYPDSPLTDVRKSLVARKRRPTLRVPSPLPGTRPPSGITPSTASTTRIPMPPPLKRISVTSPPGLWRPSRPMTPPGLSRPSRSQETTPTRSSLDEQVIEASLPSQASTSPHSRPLPTAAPPPYPRSPSPPRAASTPIRRLPTIPPEATPSPSPPQLAVRTTFPVEAPLTIIPPSAKTSTSQAFLPLSAAFSHGSSTPFSPYPPSSCASQTPSVPSGARPPSMLRSPLGVPVGPRTRVRTPSCDHGRPTPSGHRPPGLRL